MSLSTEKELACPYFVPREMVNGAWIHPSRLPLGAGWSGDCCAGEQSVTPGEAAIRNFCNLGNAVECPYLPANRDWDAVRFSVALTSKEQITLSYICEKAHAPIEHGQLTYDLIFQSWRNPHADARVHRLASSYLEAYRSRQKTSAIA